MFVNVSKVTNLSVKLDWVPASEGGDSLANTGEEVLLVFNRGLTDRKITITPEGERVSLIHPPQEITIPASDVTPIGTFSPSAYNSQTGSFSWTYDDATDLSVVAIKS